MWGAIAAVGASVASSLLSKKPPKGPSATKMGAFDWDDLYDYSSDRKEDQQEWTEEQYAALSEQLDGLISGQVSSADFLTQYGETLGGQGLAMIDQGQAYSPLNDMYIQGVQDYGSQQAMADQYARSMADTYMQAERAREAASANLTSFGIDPSQLRSGALDQSARIQTAAAAVANATNSRSERELQSINLAGQGAQMGQGMLQAGSGLYGTGGNLISNAGNMYGMAGNSAINKVNTGANLLGTELTWQNNQMAALQGKGQAVSGSFGSQLASGESRYNQMANNTGMFLNTVGSIMASNAGGGGGGGAAAAG